MKQYNILRVCKTCGQEFIAHTANRQNCMECCNRSCKICGTTFLAVPKSLRRGAKYCSIECARRDRWKGGICKVCGKTIETMKRHLFCSDKCKREDYLKKDRARGSDHRLKQRKRLWIEKSQFMMELGGKCSRCGISELRVLQFHHIDSTQKDAKTRHQCSFYQRLKCLRQEASNLELLCANCHAIETHENHWKTNGLI